MKNNIFCLLLTSFIFLSCKQESKEGINSETTNTSEVVDQSKVKGCGYTSLIEIEKNFLPTEDRVNQIVENIVSYSGLPNNFKVYRADYINNAFATIIDNERVIVYDSKLFNDVEWYSDTFWTSVSILAHEIGHHLSGHTEDNLGSVPLKELEADKFSGYVLYKMGATKEQALKAMKLIGSVNDTQTHPSQTKRLQAIEEGWDNSNNQRYKSALPPAPNYLTSDFYVFKKEMVINNDLLELNPSWFEDNGDLYGVITETDNDFRGFSVRIINSSEQFKKYFRNIEDEDWGLSIESPHFGSNTEMCHACASNLKYLLQPGRRIKFKMVESLPDHGTSLNGVWFLTYLEVLPANYFDKLPK